MKLFLASSFDKTALLLPKKLGFSLTDKKVLFISNASDNHVGDRWWVKIDRDAFISLGCQITDLDLREISKEDFSDILSTADIIHFCGGSVLHLLLVLQQKDVVSIIAEAVSKGKIIYTGTSAGSMIVSKDITLAKYDDEEAPFIDKVNNLSGFGLVSFMILPHSNNLGFIESNKKTISHTPENNTPLIVINDNQAVYVEDEKFEILNI